MPQAGRADTLAVDFTKLDAFDPAASAAAGKAGLWNIGLARVQAGIVPVGVTTPNEIDFGNGGDGAFSDGPAQAGITVSGNTITIDTSVKATFQFTSFNLSAGMTLVATGPNALTIKVLGNTVIAGTISGDGAAGAGNGLNTPAAAGGGGGPGGGAGGQGGSANGAVTSTNGSPTPGGASNKGGPSGGTNSAISGTDTGGAGGCLGSDGTNIAQSGLIGGGSAGNAPVCATSSANVAIAFETAFLAGAGGGGGMAFTSGTKPTGAGGGGGGGAIHLASLGKISVSGGISVGGGAGGSCPNSNAGANCGGAGGGGSGGSIWLQSGAGASVSGTINLQGGAGGTVSCSGAGNAAGGAGSRGVLRYDNPQGASNAIASANILPAGLAANADSTNATAVHTGQTYTVVSKPIAIPYGYSALGAPTETFDTTSAGCGSAGTATLAYEGSSDGVTFGNAVPGAQIAQLNDSPYVRFKVTFDTTAGAPPCLTGLTLNYGPRDLADLTLRGGGIFCGSVDSSQGHGKGPGTPNPFGALGDFLLLVFAVMAARYTPKNSRLRSQAGI